MAHLPPNHERISAGEPRPKVSPGRMPAAPSPVEEMRNELREALSGILSMKEMLLTNQADEQTSIKGGDDFRKKISEIPHQTSKEELILLQVFRTFLKAKPELQPILCELAEIIVAAFKNKDIRPTLSTTLEGLSTELLIQVATEKYRENERKDLKKVAAEMLVDTHPVKRVKTMEELRMEIDNIPHKTPAEERVLQTLATAAQQTEEVSFFDLASRILTAFYHTENRPNIGQCLADITPEEIHDMAIEMLAPQRSPSGRVSMERVQQMLQESQPKPNQSRPTPSTKSLPRPTSVSSDEQSIAGLSRGKEEAVTRKFATRTIKAVLDSGHLTMEMEKLKTEKIITPETNAYKLLEKIYARLKELEAIKGGSKDPQEKMNRSKTALKDFAGKIIYTLQNSDSKKNIDRFRILAKILQHMGNLLELLALILTMKRGEDLKMVETEIKAHRQTLSRWTDEDSSHMARIRTYFENGEKTLEQIEDEEKSEAHQERYRQALVDASSLIVIGLSTPGKERAGDAFKAKVKDLLQQIEVDAQGLEIQSSKDESTIIGKTDEHVTERKMDPAEQARMKQTLEAAKAFGLKEGLKKANETEKAQAEREAVAAKKAGLIDFSHVEDLLSELGD